MPSDPLPVWVLQRRRAIGDRIRETRLRRNLTQETLAEHCDLDRKTINRIEGGMASPLLDHLLLIADALDVPMTLLVRE